MNLDRITIDPRVMGGKPCIRGLRITLGTIVGLLAEGHSRVGECVKILINMSLCPAWVAVLLSLLIQAVPCAGQTPIKDTLQGIYNQTLTAMQTAKTKAEIERVVSEMDMPLLTHIGEDGHVSTSTRAQTVHELEGVIARPKRENWNTRVIWASRDLDRATAVAWVYTKSEDAAGGRKGAESGDGAVIFGTIIRDKWVLTKDGWRRSSHEKIFPDRIFVGDGQETIFPE